MKACSAAGICLARGIHQHLCVQVLWASVLLTSHALAHPIGAHKDTRRAQAALVA
jgi:hypothetical protein